MDSALVAIIHEPEAYQFQKMVDIFSRDVIRRYAETVVTDNLHHDLLPALALAQNMETASIVDTVKRSRLRGKGGASYPTYRKMELMRQQRPGKRCVVINGSEHEPGSDKDQFLLTRYPETVLEGALILARATSADLLVFAIKETASDAIVYLQSSIDNLATECGLAIDIKIVPVEETYLVGEIVR